jgi:hypothetical protein
MTDDIVDRLPLAARLRHEKRAIAIASLEALDPQDAAAIAAAVLDVVAAGEPRLDPWGDLRADAAFWADCANTAELEVYFSSILKKLQNKSLGIRARKRLFWAIWVSLAVEDQRAFFGRATAKGAAA